MPGTVRNNAGGSVTITLQGNKGQINEFIKDLPIKFHHMPGLQISQQKNYQTWKRCMAFMYYIKRELEKLMWRIE
ncbi:acylphosphatase [Clostridium sp.]|uniref:acylphosphatase n=1 Tax=Clostridium sp. TaxID=1506 RepID=UPI0035A07CC7